MQDYSKPLCIAVLTYYYFPQIGGIASHLTSISNELARKGVQVHIITKHNPGLSELEYNHKVVIHRLICRGSRIKASTFYIIKALYLLRQIRPDVIHAHELLLPTTASVISKLVLDIPVITTIHSSGDAIGEIARLKRTIFGHLRMAIVRNQVDLFIANSHVIEKEMIQEKILESHIAYIPNGIDIGEFSPVSNEEKLDIRKKLGLSNVPIGVYTGRLASEKRLDLLIKVWAKIRIKYPDALLLLVGTGPEEAVLRSSSCPGVIFTGGVGDVKPYLKASDLFILVSESEGFSISTLEALACGLPVIATPVGAIPDLVTHLVNGWIIPNSNERALHDAIITLFDSPKLRLQFSQLGRERILLEYSLNNSVDRLLSIYKNLACIIRHNKFN